MTTKAWTPPKTYRKFGKWHYSFDDGFFDKSDAKKEADTARKRGLLARIVTGTSAQGRKSYLVYWRRASY
jgi:hypothetical protein